MIDSAKDLLSFRRMLAPVIIQVLFWILTIFLIVVAFWAMFHQGFWRGFWVLLLGPISVRIIAEIIILLFRINETLTEIKNTMAVKA